MEQTVQPTTNPSQQDTQEATAGNAAEWQQLQPETLPPPTYWPVVLALGIVLLCWGIVTTFWLSGVGLVLFSIALAGWIGDLRHEH